MLSHRLPVLGLVGRYPANNRDRTQGPPRASEGYPLSPCSGRAYGVLAHLSMGYPPPGVRSLTRYSAVCHYPIGPKAKGPFDLHALGAPPAFVLSQDQTRFKEPSFHYPVVKVLLPSLLYPLLTGCQSTNSDACSGRLGPESTGPALLDAPWAGP